MAKIGATCYRLKISCVSFFSLLNFESGHGVGNRQGGEVRRIPEKGLQLVSKVGPDGVVVQQDGPVAESQSEFQLVGYHRRDLSHQLEVEGIALVIIPGIPELEANTEELPAAQGLAGTYLGDQFGAAPVQAFDGCIIGTQAGGKVQLPGLVGPLGLCLERKDDSKEDQHPDKVFVRVLNFGANCSPCKAEISQFLPKRANSALKPPKFMIE